MNDPAPEKKIAIVIPWFGRELRGGAELQAWNLAARLTARGYSIEVLTTCCGSFQADWATNHHPVGVTSEPEGFAIRRFPVEPRDRAEFDRVCGYLLGLDTNTLKPGVSPISPADEQIFREHLIRCPALLSYLKQEGWRYSAFIFLPYLYGPILDGLPLVASRALLQPCLHDEAYAYMRCVQRAVFSARKILWLSEGEYQLGRRLFGPAVLANFSVGMAGVEPLPSSSLAFEPGPLAALKPFVLLLGRKDAGKGTLLAVEAFRTHHGSGKSGLNLVIAGPGEMLLNEPENRIHDLGLVSEDHRSWLLQNATALLQPSPNESFSRVMFEAWQCQKPVVVRRSCLATSCAVRASKGGWLAETSQEWSDRLAELEGLTAEELNAIGRCGADYASMVADWERVMDRYEEALKTFVRHTQTMVRIRFALLSLKPQRVRLLAGHVEVGAWDLQPNEILEVNESRTQCTLPKTILHFVTDVCGTTHGHDPRALGFRLTNLEVDAINGATIDLNLTKGWNRSEGGPGTIGPRWSTGSAEVTVTFQRSRGPQQAIHQVLPNLGYGDAIGNHAIWIREQLHSMGYKSEIFARHIAKEMASEAYHLASPESLPADAAIIYHHSIGTEVTPWVCQHAGPKALIYHNITPASFFEPYSSTMAKICRSGREELPRLAPHFPVSAGDSSFNAKELEGVGFLNPGVLPLCIDPAHWAYPPDERVMSELNDGRTNVLFVGRIVPNKRHEDLIYTFKFWLEDDPEARLFIVGSAEVSSMYFECLQELARRLRIDHAVHFVGHVNDAQLHAYYRSASMFWCFSEHEGFCVPLIEACAFGVPVVARAESAVPETLGEAGLLLKTRQSPSDTARRIAAARTSFHQQKMTARVARYSTAKVIQELQWFITQLIHSAVDSKS